MKAATEFCSAQGLRFTKTRRRVLEILLRDHRAVGAYDILDRLAKEGLGSQPPVVYRALDFLVANRMAHKLESRNAYLACCSPGAAHNPVFLICDDCASVVEASQASAQAAIARDARKNGFEIRTAQIEVDGLCHECRDKEVAV